MLLDIHSDADHNRSVFTLAAEEHDLVESLLAGIARRRRAHRSARARRCPPARRSGRRRPARAARSRVDGACEVRGPRSWPPESERSFGFPSFSTARSATERRPAFFRRGGLDELRRRVDAGELVPDDGPREIDPRSGAVLVGARHALVAYNLDLATDDVRIARAVAASVRESSGGMRGVQAIGPPPARLRPDTGQHERHRRRCGAPARGRRARAARGRAHAASRSAAASSSGSSRSGS